MCVCELLLNAIMKYFMLVASPTAQHIMFEVSIGKVVDFASNIVRFGKEL